MKNLQLKGKDVTVGQMTGDLKEWIAAGGSLDDRSLEFFKLIEYLTSKYQSLERQVNRLSKINEHGLLGLYIREDSRIKNNKSIDDMYNWFIEKN